MLDIGGYFEEIRRIHASGKATEHSYRPALEKLFNSIVDGVSCINEPVGMTRVGRPDFVFTRAAGKGADITVGHCEAKDIGLGIVPKGMNDFNKAQHERYVKALPNLIYTNGLDFRFYKKGELAREISIGDVLMGLQPKPDQFAVLANQLQDFTAEKLQTITSAEKLAEMMAGKALLIKDILGNALKEDKDLQTELTGQYRSFRDQLIHDLTAEDFSDIYAETIAYGMFAARLHDETLQDFSREEALTLLPKSNPFLRNLFGYVAGSTLDERIKRPIDELAEIFQATDLGKLFEDFGKFTQRNDPFIHFYETFLAEYNPSKRKARGVWYTPEPVVNFLVRAVDDVLKTEFGLADGLADTSKVTIDWETGQKDKRGNPEVIKKEVHRVQILDPAAGTGTFLAEVIKQIAPKVKDVAEGQWSSYVEKELIPRLHGFELLMASYAMCHMKLDMMLTEMGYKPTGVDAPRLSVYLTNSLEEGEASNQTLPFAQWLSNEAKQANTIKRDMPIMCVVGNPPYNATSKNDGAWITDLIEDYKYIAGEHFNERKHWLHDDYVKFIRLAEALIDKNGEGILAFISNHGYLDNPTFRGMRFRLLETFDKVSVIDLHGNSKRPEVNAFSKFDQNVFDIQQGVALIIAIKTKPTPKKRIRGQDNRIELGALLHSDIWGTREEKYDQLRSTRIIDCGLTKLKPHKPYFMFVPRDFSSAEKYNAGFALRQLLPENVTGVITARDSLAIDFTKTELERKLLSFADANVSDQNAQIKFFGHMNKDMSGDGRTWNLSAARESVRGTKLSDHQLSYSYRPFDTRTIFYSEDIVDWPRPLLAQQMVSGKNLAMVVCRQAINDSWANVLVTNLLGDDSFVSNRSKERGYFFPLYLYPDERDFDQTSRVNFDQKIRKAIEAVATDKVHGKPDEVAIFDYIYGVLHCPAFRDTYKEFLKIDFPRVPYPPSPDVFWEVSAKGTQLRKLHLMEDAAIGPAPFKFMGQGDAVVGKISYESGVVRINATQGFENVPEVAWNFYIGGYQPAQKWLKDRKGRELSFEDIKHYQKVIKILSETDRIMKTITMPL